MKWYEVREAVCDRTATDLYVSITSPAFRRIKLTNSVAVGLRTLSDIPEHKEQLARTLSEEPHSK